MRQNRVLSLERIAHGAMAHGASVNEELARLKKQLEAASAENAASRAETAEAEACRLKELRRTAGGCHGNGASAGNGEAGGGEGEAD